MQIASPVLPHDRIVILDSALEDAVRKLKGVVVVVYNDRIPFGSRPPLVTNV
jgi:hypothetical protein